NHLNCPVVTGYPELIKHNIEELKSDDILFLNSCITFDHKPSLRKELQKALKDFDIGSIEMRKAINKAWEESYKYNEDIKKQGEKIVKYLEENDLMGIVLGGRPYHI